jgi:hypothetical protein
VGTAAGEIGYSENIGSAVVADWNTTAFWGSGFSYAWQPETHFRPTVFDW